MSISDPPPGPRQGPGASINPENTVNTVFFACFDTHLLSGHCRASTVSIIDTRGFGGVSRRPRYAHTAKHHEPFISPQPSGPGSGASLMLMIARFGGGGGGPEGPKTVVFCLLREKLFLFSSLCGCRVCTQHQPRPRRVGWRCSKDGSPKPKP